MLKLRKQTVSDTVPSLSSRFIMHARRKEVQILCCDPQVSSAYWLCLEGVAAIISGGFTLRPLGEFGDDLKYEFSTLLKSLVLCWAEKASDDALFP
jgi:hypothetical protein